MHKAQGAPRKHLKWKQDKKLSREMESDINRLLIGKFLFFKDENPVLNRLTIAI